MTERLQKILSARGVASRRMAEELINAGRVTCNGQLAHLGMRADPDVDHILIDGKPLPSVQEHIYIMLHKPRGYVTTLSDEKNRPTATQLVADCGKRVYPIGRLDMDSEGLLLFTNDGDFANHLMHPKNMVNKTYQAEVTGFSEVGLERLNKPMTLEGYRIKKPQAILLRRNPTDPGRAIIQIVIHEGRNRQVRKMCAAVGMQVHRLIRIQEGAVKLGSLPKGRWRYLKMWEVLLLKK